MHGSFHTASRHCPHSQHAKLHMAAIWAKSGIRPNMAGPGLSEQHPKAFSAPEFSALQLLLHPSHVFGFPFFPGKGPKLSSQLSLLQAPVDSAIAASHQSAMTSLATLELKLCKKCNVRKAVSNFYKAGVTVHGKPKYKPRCTPCYNSSARDTYRAKAQKRGASPGTASPSAEPEHDQVMFVMTCCHFETPERLNMFECNTPIPIFHQHTEVRCAGCPKEEVKTSCWCRITARLLIPAQCRAAECCYSVLQQKLDSEICREESPGACSS